MLTVVLANRAGEACMQPSYGPGRRAMLNTAKAQENSGESAHVAWATQGS